MNLWRGIPAGIIIYRGYFLRNFGQNQTEKKILLVEINQTTITKYHEKPTTLNLQRQRFLKVVLPRPHVLERICTRLSKRFLMTFFGYRLDFLTFLTTIWVILLLSFFCVLRVNYQLIFDFLFLILWVFEKLFDFSLAFLITPTFLDVVSRCGVWLFPIYPTSKQWVLKTEDSDIFRNLAHLS